ncbi:MAG: HPr family phosphocarrier protein [Candidatus Eisenbacteria bacterium]|nr:HPr family phosphocarrier protein [Candidatus Eisenbacteria bacterium]
MIEETLAIRNKLGIHLRPAEKIAQTANAFASGVSLRNGSCQVNGKSILGMLALEAGFGCRVHVIVEGPDEGEAMAAIRALIEGGFGEEMGDPEA